MSRVIRVIVGSTNKAKLEAARMSFAKAFATRDGEAMPMAEQTRVEVTGLAAPSGVADQPMGDAETRGGAFARAHNAAALWVAQGGGCPADFAVGMEGGCEDALIPLPIPLPSRDAHAATGGYRDMSCFAWMAVLHVPSGRWGWARTASFSLPPPVAALVRSGTELGVADDAVFRRSGSKQSEGAVGILTHGAIDRAAYYVHALHLALVPFLHDEEGKDGLLHMSNPRGRGRDDGTHKRAPVGLYAGHAAL